MASETKTGRDIGLGKRILFSAVAAIIAFALAEGAIRLYVAMSGSDPTGRSKPATDIVEFESPISVLDLQDFVPDPVLIWKNRASNTDKYGATINKHGFRGPDFSEHKPAGTYRIVCLGDSTVYGHGLPDGQTWPDFLKELAAKKYPGKNIEIVNAGVPGYSSFQAMRSLETQAVDWRPDVVLISVGFDDHLWSGGRPDKAVPSSSYFLANLQDVLGRSALFRLLMKSLAGQVGAPSPTAAERRVSLEDFKSNLTRMIEISKKAGAAPILLTQPVNLHKPLVLNPIRRVVKDADGAERVVFEMHRFVAGVDTLGTYSFDGPIEALIEEARLHPDWPMPPYLLGMRYMSMGNKEEAMRQFDLANKFDIDRKAMEDYNDAVIAVATQSGVRAIDLLPLFMKLKQGNPFLDDVHMSRYGTENAAAFILDFISIP